MRRRIQLERAHRERLLRNFLEYRRSAVEEGQKGAVREYVIDALDPQQLRQLTAIGETILGRLDGDTPRR